MTERREKIRKIVKWTGRALKLTAFAALVTGAVFLFRDPPAFLRVKEVVVMSPMTHLNEFDLIRLSEVRKGDNILTLKLKDVRERILRYPWVKDVRLAKRFPARLFVWVEEEEPTALIELATEGGNAELFLVNREGRVFKKLDAADPKDFPILTGLTPEQIPQHLPRLMAFVKSLETSDLFNAIGVSEAHWDGKAGLTLFTKEPCIQLTLGREGGAFTWEQRMQRFVQAWGQIQSQHQNVSVVDLSLDRRIVVKQKL
jgi:cell division septal protein FtsQ